MAQIWAAKSPSPEVVEYEVDWTDRLAGDLISTSTFALTTAAGLTKVGETFSGPKALVTLSGGTPGLIALLRNTVTTLGGDTLYDDVILPIAEGLIVEDGTGLVNAESFASVATADTYCALYGLAWQAAVADKERCLRIGAQWLTFARQWKGARLRWLRRSGGQALAWPRAGVTDIEGRIVHVDEIPIEVIYANIELAAYELAHPGGLFPEVLMQDRVRREKIGPLETEFVMVPNSAEAARPIITKVDDMLAGLLSGSGFGSSLFGGAERA